MKYSVYVIEHPDDGVIYVGCTNDLNRRLVEHRSRRPEFHGCVMRSVHQSAWRMDAEAKEAEMIRELRPRCNRVTPSGDLSRRAEGAAFLDMFDHFFGAA